VRDAAKSVDGVCDTEKIRIQQHGPNAHVDIDVEVDPHMTVERAHEISQKVRRAIQTAWPQVLDVTVHIEPYYENDH
jgi:divalent metal cation (Fe/Co/Zn/Cd) transporter